MSTQFFKFCITEEDRENLHHMITSYIDMYEEFNKEDIPFDFKSLQVLFGPDEVAEESE